MDCDRAVWRWEGGERGGREEGEREEEGRGRERKGEREEEGRGREEREHMNLKTYTKAKTVPVCVHH